MDNLEDKAALVEVGRRLSDLEEDINAIKLGRIPVGGRGSQSLAPALLALAGAIDRHADAILRSRR